MGHRLRRSNSRRGRRGWRFPRGRRRSRGRRSRHLRWCGDAGGLRSPAAAVRTPRWSRSRWSSRASSLERIAVRSPAASPSPLGRVLADVHRPHHGASCPSTFPEPAACPGCRGPGHMKLPRTGEGGELPSSALQNPPGRPPVAGQHLGVALPDCGGGRIASEGFIHKSRSSQRSTSLPEVEIDCPVPRPRSRIRFRCQCHRPRPSDRRCHARSPRW